MPSLGGKGLQILDELLSSRLAKLDSRSNSIHDLYLYSGISQIKLISLDMGPSGMPRTIITTLEDVKCSPIRSISALSWGNYLPAKRKTPKSSVLAQVAPLGQPSCCGKARKHQYLRHHRVQLPK